MAKEARKMANAPNRGFRGKASSMGRLSPSGIRLSRPHPLVAETLDNKKIQNKVAFQRFHSSDFKASTDYAKVREVCRIWVGLKYPGTTPSEFKDRLDAFENDHYNKAVELVESNAKRIEDLAVFFTREWEKAGEPANYELSQERVDAFLMGR
jgi:hypothetical protein